jgi:hypothetical protein
VVGRRADRRAEGRVNLVGAIGVERKEISDDERLPPVTATSTRLADAFLRAAIRSPANTGSPPRRKDASTWLTQSEPSKDIGYCLPNR